MSVFVLFWFAVFCLGLEVLNTAQQLIKMVARSVLVTVVGLACCCDSGHALRLLPTIAAVQRQTPTIAAFASFILCTTTPLLAAEPPTPVIAPSPSAAAIAPSEPAVPASTAGATGTINGVSAVMATDEEAKALREAAKSLELPNVAADSDLGRLLSGEIKPANSVQSPRAHSN